MGAASSRSSCAAARGYSGTARNAAGQVRIRLVARAKLAAALGCDHLQGREVSFPLKLLLGSGRGRQAEVNAALFTAVHAGQIHQQKRGIASHHPRQSQENLRLLQIPPAQL